MSHNKSDWRYQCQHNVIKIQRYPIFSIFESPEKLKDAFPSLPSSDYSSFKGLSTILNKIQENKYSLKSEWMADMQQIWIKGISIAEKNNLPLLNAISIEFRSKCIKLFFRMNEKQSDNYLKKVADLTKQLNQITYKLPKELSCSIPVENVSEK